MKTTQSASVARTWEDPEVAAKRSARHGLMVDGQNYSSTHQALKALGIGKGSQHINWRTTFKDLVNRQTGILVRGYPMLDGSYRDVMLTEPGAIAATVLHAYDYEDLADGRATVASFSPVPADADGVERESARAQTAEPITEAEAEYYQARKLDPNEPWYVYLIVEQGRLARQFKVGMALSIENRMDSLTQGLAWSLEAALTVPRPRYLAHRLEQKILDMLKEKSDCHLAGEFFAIDQRWIDVAAHMINEANLDGHLYAVT